MINIWILLGILTVHFIADFVLQTDEQAKGKSKSWWLLLDHTFMYSNTFWLFICLITQDIRIASLFWMVTIASHTIIDYITSRTNSTLWLKGNTHNFFVGIGFDQLLHYTQLILTYYYLTT